MTKNEAGGRRRATPHHVLVAPTDVGTHHLEDHAVVAAARAEGKLGEVDRPELDLSRLNVGNTLIVSHADPSC
jgi:hypothetical protein